MLDEYSAPTSVALRTIILMHELWATETGRRATSVVMLGSSVPRERTSGEYVKWREGKVITESNTIYVPSKQVQSRAPNRGSGPCARKISWSRTNA